MFWHCRQMQQEWRGREEGLKQQLQQVTESSAAQIRDLQHRAQQAEERLKGQSLVTVLSGVDTCFNGLVTAMR